MTAIQNAQKWNVTVDPSINGVLWIREAKASEKPLRKLLAMTVEQSLENSNFRQESLGRRGMTVIYISDMDHLITVLEGERSADCAFIPLSTELEPELGSTDFTNVFIFCIVLEKLDVALISRFHLDNDRFMNA